MKRDQRLRTNMIWAPGQGHRFCTKQPYHTIPKEGDKTYAGGGWRISRGVADSSQVLKGGGVKILCGFLRGV